MGHVSANALLERINDHVEDRASVQVMAGGLFSVERTERGHTRRHR